MLNKKKNNKGFTLVELLVVIAIIGILAVVAVPALFKNINKAKVADLESDYSAIKSAVLSYYAEENTVPQSTEITQLAEHMDSVPTKSALGEGGYSLVKGTSPDKSFYLEIGAKDAIICGKHEHNDSCEQSSCNIESDHKHDDNCTTDKGVTLTEDQLKRLVQDIGSGNVYVYKGSKFEQVKDSNISTCKGENKIVRLTLINDIDM